MYLHETQFKIWDDSKIKWLTPVQSPCMSQMNPFHTLHSYFHKIYFDILPAAPRSF